MEESSHKKGNLDLFKSQSCATPNQPLQLTARITSDTYLQKNNSPNDVMTVIGLMSTGILRPFAVLMNLISASHDLQRGMIHLLKWFATNGGVSHYHDGIFSSLDTRDFGTDNTAQNYSRQIYEDSSGRFWIATGGGVIRYVPNQVLPWVFITSIKADTVHTDFENLTPITAGRWVAIEYLTKNVSRS